jgi:hypothetical protein
VLYLLINRPRAQLETETISEEAIAAESAAAAPRLRRKAG